MNKKTVAAIVLSVVALCLSIAGLIVALLPKQAAGDVQYVLYLGTNDKDTNEQVFAPDEAKTKAEEILLKHVGGWTIQEANGGWADGDMLYREYTIVIYLSDTSADAVHAAADELVAAFHQSSVLIQKNVTATEFYYGRP